MDKKQTVEEKVQEDGSVKERMGKAGLDLLNKLKSGQKNLQWKLSMKKK